MDKSVAPFSDVHIRSNVGVAPKASFVEVNQASGPYEEVRAHEALGFSAAAALDLEVWSRTRFSVLVTVLRQQFDPVQLSATDSEILRPRVWIKNF